MISEFLKIASYLTGRTTFRPRASVHRQGNETGATLGQKGQEKFAKWQQAALHSDTLTCLKYIKYWVA